MHRELMGYQGSNLSWQGKYYTHCTNSDGWFLGLEYQYQQCHHTFTNVYILSFSPPNKYILSFVILHCFQCWWICSLDIQQYHGLIFTSITESSDLYFPISPFLAFLILLSSLFLVLSFCLSPYTLGSLCSVCSGIVDIPHYCITLTH